MLVLTVFTYTLVLTAFTYIHALVLTVFTHTHISWDNTLIFWSSSKFKLVSKRVRSCFVFSPCLIGAVHCVQSSISSAAVFFSNNLRVRCALRSETQTKKFCGLILRHALPHAVLLLGAIVHVHLNRSTLFVVILPAHFHQLHRCV